MMPYRRTSGLQPGAMDTAMLGLVRSHSLGLRPAASRILFGASQAPQILVDVQSDVMYGFIHDFGCLVS